MPSSLYFSTNACDLSRQVSSNLLASVILLFQKAARSFSFVGSVSPDPYANYNLHDLYGVALSRPAIISSMVGGLNLSSSNSGIGL